MDAFELFQLSQQMRETPEFARLQELNRLANTLSIFEANYRDLDRLLWFVCDSSAGDRLFRRENRSAWEQAMAEVIHLLQNFVASVSALIDHSRRLYSRLYEVTSQFPEYQEEVKSRFANDEVVQFVQGLRNYCLHYRTPAIGTTSTVLDMQEEKFQRRVTLSKSDLLDFEWNSAAKRFLAHAPRSIDLRETINSYHAAVEEFYNWFAERTRALHASDYEMTSRFYAALLSGKSEQHLAALEDRMKACEAGIGTPFDVLNPFMTLSDSSEIGTLLQDPHKWVDAALERVSKYLPILLSTTSQRLHDIIERNRDAGPRRYSRPDVLN